ncbi:MAG: class II aldolase/adducin family protein [Vulcanimicrobiaceae bacterium]
MRFNDASDAILTYARELWDRRLTTGSSGNLSARLDDGDILVTPTGRSVRNLRGDELVRIAPDGTPRDARTQPTTELPLHLAAYRVRDDIDCVIHSHPTFCVVWTKTGRIFARDTVGARESLGEVGWAPYAPPGSNKLADDCATVFADGCDCVLMERHGLSCASHGFERAFVLTDLAEEAARIAYFSSLLQRSPEEGPQ